LAALLELVYRLKAAIEELLSAPLGCHFPAECRGCAFIDCKLVTNHNAVPLGPFDGHESRFDVEFDPGDITLEGIAAAATSPGIEVDEVSRLDFDVITLGRQPYLRAIL